MDSESHEKNPAVATRMVYVFAGATAAIAAVALLGWLTGIRFFTSIREIYFPMPPSTAFAFIILSGSLMLLIWRPTNKPVRYLAIIFQVFVLVTSAEIMYEYLAGIDHGIEENVFQIQGALNGVPLGRMSPMAALSFFLSCLALQILTLAPLKQTGLKQASVVISMIVGLVGLVTAVGYFYGTPLLYGGSTRPIAPTASAGFILLNAAVITAAGNTYWPARALVGDSVQAILLRTFLPIVVVVLFVDGLINANVPHDFSINPSLISAFVALVFIALSSVIIFVRSRRIGGAIDQANEQRDIAEAKLQETLADLERSNEELQQFAYIASHDLQEPLRMVTSFVQLLQKRYEGKLDQDADEFIGFAVDGAKRMQAMILDLLTLSRVGTHGGKFLPVQGEELLGRAAANLHIAITESNARITHDPLPEITADETQLTQLFQNLIAQRHQVPR